MPTVLSLSNESQYSEGRRKDINSRLRYQVGLSLQKKKTTQTLEHATAKQEPGMELCSKHLSSINKTLVHHALHWAPCTAMSSTHSAAEKHVISKDNEVLENCFS